MWLEFAFDQAYLNVLRAGQRQTGQVTPEVTEQVTEQVARLVLALGEQTLSLRELMQALGLSHRPNFLALHLRPGHIASSRFSGCCADLPLLLPTYVSIRLHHSLNPIWQVADNVVHALCRIFFLN